MNFFTSDTHYNHKNIIKYCERPFANVEEMNRELVERHNAIVKPGDTVYHLNGKIIYLRGNHDKSGIEYLTVGNIILCHYPFLKWFNMHRGYIHLFGHVHGTVKGEPGSVDVGVDSPWVTGKREYRPFTEDEVRRACEIQS